MKWFFNPCRDRRQQLCLLASDLLPDTEKDQILKHLAACPACQKYFNEIKSVTTSLDNSKAEFTNLQSAPTAHARWTAAIRAAGAQEPVQKPARAIALREWYLDVIWPYRRAWTSFATLWILIFMGHLSLRDHSQVMMAKASPRSQQQMVVALKDRQAILAELLADHSSTREADRQRYFLPKPRTNRTEFLMT